MVSIVTLEMVVNSESHNLNVTSKRNYAPSIDLGAMKIVLLALLVASDIVKGRFMPFYSDCFASSMLGFSTGVVEISPSVVAPVCQAGDQLELTCSVAGVFLRWEFTVILEDGRSRTFMPVVTAGGSSGVQPPRMANSTRFTFSRLSIQPLTSTMTINNVSEGLNGVQMNCVDVETSESATTTIQIVDARGRNYKNMMMLIMGSWNSFCFLCTHFRCTDFNYSITFGSTYEGKDHSFVGVDCFTFLSTAARECQR